MVTRFVKFVGARLLTLVLDLALAYFLVDTYPEIIGQFVGHSHAWVNGIESLFSQVLIIVLNYIISKFFVFTDEESISKKEVVRKCVKTISYQPPFLI